MFTLVACQCDSDEKVGGITALWLQQPASFSLKASASALVDTCLQGIANDP
jgi:hypothetical protein